MSAWPFVGFLCVAGVAIGFADYTVQARAAKVAFGAYSVQSYLDSVRLRYANAATARSHGDMSENLASVHRAAETDNGLKWNWMRYLHASDDDDIRPRESVVKGLTARFTDSSSSQKTQSTGAQSRSMPKRLELSGGRSCLSGKRTGLCN